MTIYKETTGHGPDIVTLHGWSCNQRHMQPIVDQLKNRYRVTNVNLPGISHTPWQAETKTVHDVADQIIAVMPDKAIYIGWSFGGLVSMSIAARYPERVERFIGVTTTPKFIAADNWPGVPQPGFKAPFEEVKKVGMRAFFTAYYDNEFANMNPKPKAYHDLIQILDELVDADLDILFNGVDMCDVTDLRKEYQSIKCPIDLILGEKDESLPAAMHASILQLNPKANIHTIPGANHLPFWTHPNEFNPILANILG